MAATTTAPVDEFGLPPLDTDGATQARRNSSTALSVIDDLLADAPELAGDIIARVTDFLCRDDDARKAERDYLGTVMGLWDKGGDYQGREFNPIPEITSQGAAEKAAILVSRTKDALDAE